MTAKKTTKTQPTDTTEKAPKAAKAAKQKAKPKKLSALDAAAKLLGETGQPMNCQEMIEAMSKKGLWTSPGGKTPHATLYSAILRELKAKGKDARFKKTERGKFAAA
jgi:HB1, ASXL, restriction endonuclease HTH domain